MSTSITERQPGRGTEQELLSRPERVRRILVVSSFPSKPQPVHTVFVKERVKAFARIPGYEVRVIAPTPYFPPLKWFKRWYPWSQVPRTDCIEGLNVTYPRYFMLPKLGGYIEPKLMLRSVYRAARQIREEFDFDLIDAHFVYPNGVVAAKLGKLVGKPVVITGRGEDMLRFPDLPLMHSQIRRALCDATQLVAVSEEIADAMRRDGGDRRRITVIPNGVDCEKFHPSPTLDARIELKLPLDRPIVVSAGYRIERKGFHILVDAIPQIREQFPNVLVAIVGGEARWERDFLPVIRERIRSNGVEEHVLIAGNRPQGELATWYSAANVFALLTSREGSPNVLLEALACGTPAVATPVGGIVNELADDRLGILLPERSAEAAATGIVQALTRTWDRSCIRRVMERRSWHETSRQVSAVFDRALSENHDARLRNHGVPGRD